MLAEILLPMLLSTVAHAETKQEKCFIVESSGWNGTKYRKQKSTPLELTADTADRTEFKTTLLSGIALDMYVGGGATGPAPALTVDINLTDKKTGVTSSTTAFFIKGAEDFPNNRSAFIYSRANKDTVAIDCFPAP